MKVTAVEHKVLIKPDIVEEQTSGGLYLPESVREREGYSVDRGEIVNYDEESFWYKKPGRKPLIGEIVIFNRYAGSLITIKDNGKNEKFRLCNDEDICAIIEE